MNILVSFAALVAVMIPVAVYYLAMRLTTVIYIDRSGSMCVPPARAKTRAILNREGKRLLGRVMIKFFDDRMSGQSIVYYRDLKNLKLELGGGGSMAYSDILKDFAKTGMKRAVIITDDYLWDGPASKQAPVPGITFEIVNIDF